jgi:hypothetical protein
MEVRGAEARLTSLRFPLRLRLEGGSKPTHPLALALSDSTAGVPTAEVHLDQREAASVEREVLD